MLYKIYFVGENIEESITAFRFQAFYYLLRPFREEDLQFLLYKIGKEQGEKAKSYLRKLPIESQRVYDIFFQKENIKLFQFTQRIISIFQHIHFRN